MSLAWLEKRFIYFTECQLATLERLRMRKSTSQSDLRRHSEIADGMVGACKHILSHGAVDLVEVKKMKAPRLVERLASQPAGEP